MAAQQLQKHAPKPSQWEVFTVLMCHPVYLVYDARICLLGAAKRKVEGVQQPREERYRVALLRDLELLLRAEYDRLQHFVRANVRLEVLRVPQLPYQFTEPLCLKICRIRLRLKLDCDYELDSFILIFFRQCFNRFTKLLTYHKQLV